VEVARITRTASPLQGAVCFSPAGDRLAYLDHGLHRVDLATGRRRAIPDTAWARVVAWGGDAVFLAGPGPRIVRIDPGGAVRELLNGGTSALPDRLFVHRGDLLLVGHRERRYTFGREVAWSMARLPTGGGAAEPLFESSAVYLPHRVPAGGGPHLDPLGASPDLSPDGHLAVVLRHLPPAAPAYAELLAGPLAQEGWQGVRRAKWRVAVCGVTWSPDGRLAAAAGGALRILGAAGHIDRTLPLATCAPPAWSPTGAPIFAGGRLIDPDSGEEVDLFPPDPTTTATWSADGRLLAVVRPDGLWLVRLKGGAPPTAVAAQRELLDRLHRDGVIDDATYRERLRRLPPASPPDPAP